MKVVTVVEWSKQLRRYLRLVRSGEVLVVHDGGGCLVRVVPVDPDCISDHEARWVAEGS